MKESEKHVAQKVAMGLAVLISIGEIFVVAYPTGWHVKTTHIWTFYAGLFSCEVKMDTLGGTFIKKAVTAVGTKNVVAKMEDVLTMGSHSIQHLKDEFCNIEVLSGGVFNNCHVWQAMYFGGLLAAFGLGVSVLLKLIGVSMLFLPPSRCVHLTAMFCLFAAAFCSMGAVTAYAVVTYPFKEWLVAVLLAHDGFTFGSMAILAAVVSIGTPLPPILIMACGNRGGSDEEEQEFQVQQMMRHEADYGAAGQAHFHNPSMGPGPPGHMGPLPPRGPSGNGPPPPGYYDPSMGPPPGPMVYQGI